MNLSEYITLPAVNFSTLKYIDISPLHYRHAVDVGREDTTALLKFRAIHTAILEPDVFDERYVVYPGERRQGNDWKKFQADHVGCEIIKADEREKILAAADAVMNHPVANALFDEGEAERAIAWTDTQTGLQCKARLDWWSPLVLADVKSGPINDRLFAALAARFKYHVQVAWYLDALKIEMKIPDDEEPAVKLVVVEPEPPHDVAVFAVGKDELQIGRETYRDWLDRVAFCQKTGLWPGRYPNEQVLSLPRYVYEDDEQEDGTHEIVEGEE